MKSFFSNIFLNTKQGKKARVFVLDINFWPRKIFVSMGIAITQWLGHCKVIFIKVKKIFNSNKRSSLFFRSVMEEEKSFIRLTPDQSWLRSQTKHLDRKVDELWRSTKFFRPPASFRRTGRWYRPTLSTRLRRWKSEIKRVDIEMINFSRFETEIDGSIKFHSHSRQFCYGYNFS